MKGPPILSFARDAAIKIHKTHDTDCARLLLPVDMPAD